MIECFSISVWPVPSIFLTVLANVFLLGPFLADDGLASLRAILTHTGLLLARSFPVDEEFCQAWELSGFKWGCCD